MTLADHPIIRPVPIVGRRLRYRRYAIEVITIITLSALVIAVVNLLVDPFGIFRLVDWPAAQTYNRANNTRMAKAEAVRRPLWDAVIIGNSRAEMGLDPQHSAWSGR